MADPADTQRLIGDLAREGVVVSVDLAAGTAVVRFADELKTGDIPWLSARMGGTRTWSPPSVGEQVVVLAPEADTARAIIIGSLSSDARPHPASDRSMTADFGDGALICYDPEGHDLTAYLPQGASVLLVANGGIHFTGDLTVDGAIRATGKIAADGDVTAGGKVTAAADVVGKGKSLATHVHPVPPSGTSGPPA